jgi:tripartite-type tricarboxylate transporter receptor subunit TctC
MMAPAGTPQAVIDRLVAASKKAAADPGVAAKLDQQGVDPVGGTPAQFAERIKRELKEWRELAASAHIKLQ